MTTIADHDAYIAAAPEPFRPSLKLLRALLTRALPEAEEVVAYNMPGFRIGGSVVASYAAFSIHMVASLDGFIARKGGSVDWLPAGVEEDRCNRRIL